MIALEKWSGKRFAAVKEEIGKSGIAFQSIGTRAGLRKAIIDGRPVLANVGGVARLLVGEDEGFFVADTGGGKLARIADDDLDREFSGESIVPVAPVDDRPEPIIWASDQDTWGEEKADAWEFARATLAGLAEVGPCHLPPHPVVVMFKEPGEKEKKEKIRSQVFGADVVIFDHSAPVDEILHEIGHVFFSTRVTPEEAARAKELFQELTEAVKAKKRIPAVFTDRYSWSTPEEFFCTLYLWYLKGLLVNPGYLSIFRVQYPDGFRFVEDVFSRVRRGQEIEKAWNPYAVRDWLHDVTGRGKVYRVTGRRGRPRMLKAQTAAAPESLAIPESVGYDVLYEFEGRRWVSIRDGLLKAETVVVKENGEIDAEYMKARGRELHLVPIRKAYVSGNQERVRVQYVDIAHVIEEPPGATDGQFQR